MMSADNNQTAGVAQSEEKLLIEQIDNIVSTTRMYGYRRVTAQLRLDGLTINRKRVLRLMKANGLAYKAKKRKTNTTDSDHPHRKYPNLLKSFKVNRLNQVWVSDMTYIRLEGGFVYLAAILDLYSRRCIGWALSKNIDTELTLQALMMAIETRKPGAGLIHHSDQGVQYASHRYTEALEQIHAQVSMSRKACPTDNAYMESFMGTLKREEVDLSDYGSYEEVLEGLDFFLEELYNRKRLHSSLGYKSPMMFEKSLPPD
jgi:putative transposase